MITTIKYADGRKIFLILFSMFISYLASMVIVNEDFRPIAGLVFSGVVLILYFKQFEFLILIILSLNHELFYLLPGGLSGRATYKDLLYIIFLLTGIGYFWGRKKYNSNEPLQNNSYPAPSENQKKGATERFYKIRFGFEQIRRGDFKLFVISFLFLTGIGIFNSYSQGQPFILALKAAKNYFLILFYFIFISKQINQKKLFRLIIIIGLLLFIINNIQYLTGNVISIFHRPAWAATLETERAGRLRFLVGDFFTMFAPIIAFGEYLRTYKKLYLMVFIYMAITLVLQGMTRAVVFGMLIPILPMCYFSHRINYKKAAFFILVFIVLFVWFLPLLQSSFLGKMYKNTQAEISGKSGNIGIRLAGYKYYYGEIIKSPVIGMGIWNDAWAKGNREDMKYRRIHLSDLGIVILIVRFGLLGVFWLVVVLLMAYKTLFHNHITLNENIHYGLIGYFVFNIATMPTLVCFIQQDGIIYFALVLALLNQSTYLKKDHLRLG